jgi:hypothetical protein
MKSGDVHPHPGPTTLNKNGVNSKGRQPKFPCTVCKKGVVSNSKAVSCDFCDEWTHIKCTNSITNDMYDQLVNGSNEINFICKMCSFKQLPFYEDRSEPPGNVCDNNINSFTKSSEDSEKFI